MVVCAGRWPGLPLGLVFRLLIHRVTRLTGRADGGIVGAQASGDARALRRPVGFVISLTLRVLTHTRFVLSLTLRVQDGAHLGHHLVMRDTGAGVVDGLLHLGAKPPIIGCRRRELAGMGEQVIERGRAVDVRSLELLVGLVRLEALDAVVGEHLGYVVLPVGPRRHCWAGAAAGGRPNKARSSGRVSCCPIISSILSFGHSPRSTLERMAAPTRILRCVSSVRFFLASGVFTLASAFCFNALACLSLSSKSLTRCCAFSMLVAMIVLCGFIWHSSALKWCRKASYNGGADSPGEERKRRARAHLGVDCVNSCSPAAG